MRFRHQSPKTEIVKSLPEINITQFVLQKTCGALAACVSLSPGLDLLGSQLITTGIVPCCGQITLTVAGCSGRPCRFFDAAARLPPRCDE